MATDRLPSMPFFVGDYLSSGKVRMMTLEERGAYLELLFYQWQEGSIPSNLLEAQRMLGAEHVLHFERIWTAIRGQFEPDGHGNLVNRKLEEVRSKVIQISEKKRLAGRAGGKASGRSRRSNVLQANAKQNEASKSKSKTTKKNPPKPPAGASVDTAFDTFWAAYPRKESRLRAVEAFRKAKVSNGTLESILAWLDRAKKSEQWQDPSKIPHPATWLNQKRWEADPPPDAPVRRKRGDVVI